ncbi:MAG TPA: HAD-IA family hydrolase, partial [Chloroflexota bacterium]|nr:HAD-IA family hydrolase [Chloroflexota bacterium]
MAVLSPASVDAVIFDVDGVITDTAEAHAASWKRLLDEYREERLRRGDSVYPVFDIKTDYLKHLDGRPRFQALHDYLLAQGIRLPWGDPGDDPQRETIYSLGVRKNAYFRAWLESHQVRAYPDAVEVIDILRCWGIKLAVISASRNCSAVLASAGVADRFEVRVDGNDMARLGLPGKPDPAIFRRAAELLGIVPARSAMVEDSIAGVEAGVSGGFGLVVGVARGGSAPLLR